ncbi:SpoIIE family protein phosphatase [Georgenia sp. SYP-B2076]|uniref:ATP-binding SpoIIE family protein phosphatase n=1 Tax=Georgenia sp. SYP-B2076 TaxID=2495881 RepID=UPI000F8DD94E|nr:SpoIIE family protein phosphatase [Georgenia sp. SYP-B2076]
MGNPPDESRVREAVGAARHSASATTATDRGTLVPIDTPAGGSGSPDVDPAASPQDAAGAPHPHQPVARTSARADHDSAVAVPRWAEAVLEQLPEAVAVVETGPENVWKTVAVNRAAAALSGYSREQLLGDGPDLLRAPCLGLDGQRSVGAALARREPASLTTLARRADGSEYWAGLELAPLDMPGAPTQLWTAVMRDVSAQVETVELERVRAEVERRARVGLSLVARVSDLLQEADAGDVLRAIADLLTRQVVAWSGFVVAGRTLQEVDGIADDPPADHAAALRRGRGAERDVVLELLLGNTMRTVRLAPDVPAPDGSLVAQLLEIVRPHLEHAPDAAGEVLVLPVLGRQRTLGLLVALPRREPAGAPVADEQDPAEGSPVLPDEVGTVLELVARRVGMAMDNAQLYAREHVLAETLQRAMLPEQADVEGLDVWTYYAPNAEHAQVGGDWYDVVNLHDSVVAVVIGDVVGHDVEAAAAMGQLRSVVRAFAAELVDPGTVLARVDALVTGMRIPRTASLVYATLTPRGEVWDLAYSRAGHLPPLRLRDGEVTALDGAGGTLVGFGTGERETARTEVLPGDVLVLFTDGLVERRDRPMRDGVEALRALTARVHAPDAAGVGEELLQLADAPEDDVAIVVIRVPGGPESEVDSAAPRRRRWQMPVDAASIGRARHAVRRACAAWGIEDVAAAELVISELMANAVMHGWGRIGLRLQDTGDGLRIEVEDANPAPPITRERHAGRVGGFGMHIVDRLADWGWRPTPTGKVVWARLRSESGRRPDAGPVLGRSPAGA